MTDPAIYLREDDVAALATPPGRAAIAVLRLTGPGVIALAGRVFHPASALSHPRRMVYGALIDPRNGETIDRVMAAAFPAPNSYTGENMAEIHCHGGEAVVRAALELLYREGARPAEPGEFTFRAVRHGKMDLARAEAVGSLIESRSRLARSMSLRMLEGAFSEALAELREAVTGVMVELETQLEFPDEAMEEALGRELKAQTAVLAARAEALERRAVREQRFEQGVIAVLAGRPNVGKSSLFNRLIGRERAIVTPHAGTTRDSIEASIELAGRPLTLIDTAGLRETREEIEAIGVERSRRLLSESHLVMLVFEAGEGLCEEERRLLAEIERERPETRVLLVANKNDLVSAAPAVEPRWPVVSASAKTPGGVDALLKALESAVTELAPVDEDGAFLVGERQARRLAELIERLRRADAMVGEGVPLEVAAEELRAALDAIAELDGSGVAPDIMTAIFSRFCIGK
ncbi:MAG: tRNA uridine-5-carboxymethylaminomethyl(34) synthesis GTPase MnmE [bacterium]|nr:tRNA uridine-5-carboxymethylaminomethyl(34) synthesis GTPase MnmE [bacterium]